MQEFYSFFLRIILPLIPLLILLRLFFYRFRDKKGTNSSDGTMRKISLDSFLLKKLGINNEDYYYDSSYLYQVNGEYTQKIPLSDIVKVSSGTTTINNRRMWSVKYRQQGGEKQVQFIHNFTFFNRNFIGFLSAVKSANPEVY
ncbi:hypothetical protein [Pectobacterium fontis]|uniref:Uncharacterized protein n=1 Tax=Pectobacterium fontis TaxID=2558042 RepID=A0A7V8IGA1_9GAMM|nr:hypothetical protein [Pectobacterium fontis]KHN49797.1 hypothetical protein OI69_16855 [Pectobacterium fontis]